MVRWCAIFSCAVYVFVTAPAFANSMSQSCVLLAALAAGANGTEASESYVNLVRFLVREKNAVTADMLQKIISSPAPVNPFEMGVKIDGEHDQVFSGAFDKLIKKNLSENWKETTEALDELFAAKGKAEARSESAKEETKFIPSLRFKKNASLKVSPSSIGDFEVHVTGGGRFLVAYRQGSFGNYILDADSGKHLVEEATGFGKVKMAEGPNGVYAFYPTDMDYVFKNLSNGRDVAVYPLHSLAFYEENRARTTGALQIRPYVEENGDPALLAYFTVFQAARAGKIDLATGGSAGSLRELPGEGKIYASSDGRGMFLYDISRGSSVFAVTDLLRDRTIIFDNPESDERYSSISGQMFQSSDGAVYLAATGRDNVYLFNQESRDPAHTYRIPTGFSAAESTGFFETRDHEVYYGFGFVNGNAHHFQLANLKTGDTVELPLEDNHEHPKAFLKTARGDFFGASLYVNIDGAKEVREIRLADLKTGDVHKWDVSKKGITEIIGMRETAGGSVDILTRTMKGLSVIQVYGNPSAAEAP